jgi:hypothetical protein
MWGRQSWRQASLSLPLAEDLHRRQPARGVPLRPMPAGTTGEERHFNKLSFLTSYQGDISNEA